MDRSADWRCCSSWNAFGADINDTVFTKHIDALTQARDELGGHSLASLGYDSVGIDGGDYQ